MVHATPTLIRDGRLLVATTTNQLFAIDPESLNVSFTFTAGGGIVHSEPRELSDGTVVFGSYDKCVYFLTPAGRLRTKFCTQGWVHGAPLILADDTVVIGSMDGNLYFLDANGNLKAKFSTGAKVISSPVLLMDGTIVFGSYNGNVYFLSSEGALRATFKTGGKIWATPAVLGDQMSVTIGSGDHKVYFLELKAPLQN